MSTFVGCFWIVGPSWPDDFHFPSADVSRDQRSLVRGYSYIPVVYCLNKIDAISIEELDLLYRIPHAVPISSEHGWNIDELMEAMWEKLNLKRVYTKPKGKQPDYSQPVVLRSNRSTVEDFVSANIPFIQASFPRDRSPWRLYTSLLSFSAYGPSTETCLCSATLFTAVLWSNSNQPLCMASPSSINRRGSD